MAQKDYIHVIPRPSGSRDIEIAIDHLDIPESNTELIRDFRLTLKKGEWLILTGLSGSGKSSLIKALAGIWDAGKGRIDKPDDLRTLCIGQKWYAPRDSLSKVLSSRSRRDLPPVHFDPADMENALHIAGHDRLVQYIPGRTVRRVMDALLERIQAGKAADHEVLQQELEALVPELVKANTDVFQGVTQAERNDFRIRCVKQLGSQEQAETLSRALCDRIDEALAAPLIERLSDTACMLLERHAGAVRRDRKREFMIAAWGALTKQLAAWQQPDPDKAPVSGLRKIFTRNPDSELDGLALPDACQVACIRDSLTLAIEAALQRRDKKCSILKTIFNEAAWPLLPLRERRAANAIARGVVAEMHARLTREVVNGDVLSKRLSGGEQQRLAFTRAFLQRPDLLVLDESTSALDRGAARELYESVKKYIPGVTVISIAHNMDVMEHHTLHAELKDKKITITPVPVQKAIPEPVPG